MSFTNPSPPVNGPVQNTAIVNNKPRIRNKIQYDMPTTSNRNSIWALNDVAVPLDLNKFVDSFCINPQQTANIKNTDKAVIETRQIINILDLRKANIAIGLSRSKQWSFRELRCQLACLSINNIYDLLHIQGILPNDEDLKLIQNWMRQHSSNDGDTALLGTAKQFMIKMAKDPNIEQMTRIQLIMLQFDQTFSMVNSHFSMVDKTCLKN